MLSIIAIVFNSVYTMEQLEQQHRPNKQLNYSKKI